MKLRERLEILRPLRVAGEPASEKPLCVITTSQAAQAFLDWLEPRTHLRLGHLVIADLNANVPVELELPPIYGKPEIHTGVGCLNDLAGPFLFFMPQEWHIAAISRAFPRIAASQSYIAGKIPAARTPLPDYYKNNADALEAAYFLLETELDREHFARRVKALMTGDPGYLAIAPFNEYEHPEIAPAEGDVMIDGGVSDMVWAQQEFARKVGPDGAIHGFEPIPWMAESASAQLAATPWYHLHDAGLADQEGYAEFSDLRDSSRLGATAGAKTVKCRLESIDGFAEKAGLKRVDCVKLDIEGAELSALKGGSQTIRLDKPKLIICLYHKPEDMWEIPLYVKSLLPGHALHVAHSSAGFTDTILYAAPKKS